MIVHFRLIEVRNGDTWIPAGVVATSETGDVIIAALCTIRRREERDCLPPIMALMDDVGRTLTQQADPEKKPSERLSTLVNVDGYHDLVRLGEMKDNQIEMTDLVEATELLYIEYVQENPAYHKLDEITGRLFARRAA